MSKNYYEILGVKKDASADEIKTAFRKKAHEHHPDKGGDESKFKEVNEAYQILGNNEKRQQYDRFGSSFQNGQGFGGQGFGGQGFGGFEGVNINMDDLGDIFGGFGDMFGFGPSHSSRHRARGRDIELILNIDFLDAIHGAEKEISYARHKKCDHCGGSGHAPGAKVENCKTCGGSGRVNRIQRTILGAIQTQSICPDCQGEGKKASAECSHCRGRGVNKETEKIKVKIPAGIESGESIRLSSYGDVGEKGSSSGDLYLKIIAAKHSKFQREGADIYSQENVSVKQAILGGNLEVDTVYGVIKLKIPEGTQPQTVFRLKEKGAPRLHGRGIGDHFVKLQVKIPTGLTKKQKKLIEDIEI